MGVTETDVRIATKSKSILNYYTHDEHINEIVSSDEFLNIHFVAFNNPSFLSKNQNLIWFRNFFGWRRLRSHMHIFFRYL